MTDTVEEVMPPRIIDVPSTQSVKRCVYTVLQEVSVNTECDVWSCDRMEKSSFLCQEGKKPLGRSMVRTLSHVSNMSLKGPLRGRRVLKMMGLAESS
jgi:hypothetical protein